MHDGVGVTWYGGRVPFEQSVPGDTWRGGLHACADVVRHRLDAVRCRRAVACATHGAQDPAFSEGDAYERFMERWSRLLAPLLVEFAAVHHMPLCRSGELSALRRESGLERVSEDALIIDTAPETPALPCEG